MCQKYPDFSRAFLDFPGFSKWHSFNFTNQHTESNRLILIHLMQLLFVHVVEKRLTHSDFPDPWPISLIISWWHWISWYFPVSPVFTEGRNPVFSMQTWSNLNQNQFIYELSMIALWNPDEWWLKMKITLQIQRFRNKKIIHHRMPKKNVKRPRYAPASNKRLLKEKHWYARSLVSYWYFIFNKRL